MVTLSVEIVERNGNIAARIFAPPYGINGKECEMQLDTWRTTST
jgi:hypothetical protein